MEYLLGNNITIWEKYNPFELSLKCDDSRYTEELMNFLVPGYNSTKIRIGNKWYDAIHPSKLYRLKNEDGYYHFIYIQINITSCEYYIGKVNRKRWSEIKRYQGSGLRFKSKYSVHRDEFVRYYIATCRNAKETEKLEAQIVNDELLKDPFCLNIVCGGGGTNNHNNKEEKRKRQSEYMKSHPEQLQQMIHVAQMLFCSGETDALSERNKKIRQTMRTDEYRKMSSNRIKNWIKSNPDEYRKSRENNRKAQQTNLVKEKKEGWSQKVDCRTPRRVQKTTRGICGLNTFGRSK